MSMCVIYSRGTYKPEIPLLLYFYHIIPLYMPAAGPHDCAPGPGHGLSHPRHRRPRLHSYRPGWTVSTGSWPGCVDIGPGGAHEEEAEVAAEAAAAAVVNFGSATAALAAQRIAADLVKY